MSDWSGVRGDWDRDVREARSRANWATGALVATVIVSCYQIAVFAGLSYGLWTPTLIEVGVMAELSILLATAVLFLRWLHRVVTLTRTISTYPLRWTPSAAVWSFFIPFVSFYRPYQVLRDVHDWLDPEAVPEPAPRPRLDGSGGYRSVPMDRAPPPRTLPHASIGLWWGLFIATRFLGSFGAVSQVVMIVAMAVAVLVVRAIEGRLEERYRRVSFASDEELEAWGVRDPSAP